jgi:uncharacterized membrane protein
VKLLFVIVLLGAVAYFAPAPVQHVEQTIEIGVPRERMWSVLGDVTESRLWDPGMKDLKVVSDVKTGIGTAVEAQGPMVKSTEMVTEFDDFNRVKCDVTHEPPITKYETSTLSLEPGDNGNSRVKWEMDYQMAGGYLGHFADKVLLGSVHGGRISDGLSNLKRYAETGETPVTL